MNDGRSRTPYSALVNLADRLLEDCEDDVECLAVRLGGLDPGVRDELLTSDLLNAWQVFWYCFRTDPGIFLREMMDLEPASMLATGLKLGEIDLLDLFFLIRDDKPWIILADGEKTVASFSGRTAYADAMKYCENPDRHS
ncbi:MAG: hypothetical protein ABSG49_09175 [Methanoregula sp.]|jgi:hypothetical protein|uniref:hypothetical protein n=1 Tax=Methanoregula sp. TaxID=2052170 RepID=UPI003C2448F7